MRPALRGIFVVGTDTGVGKTFVAAALCRALRQAGRPVAGLKPYESGCRPTAKDAAALEREAQSGLPLSLRCPFRYRAAIAPAIAAEQEGRVDPIGAAVKVVLRAAQGRFLIVESAGGLASPVSKSATNLDLAVALGLPCLLIGRNALGTLSQISLAVEALRAREVPLLGLVLSRGVGPRDPSQATNVDWARRLTQVRPTFALPRVGIAHAARLLSAELRLNLD